MFTLEAYSPRTDGRTDGRRANFLERYDFDNHPFGVDNKLSDRGWSAYIVTEHARNGFSLNFKSVVYLLIIMKMGQLTLHVFGNFWRACI